MPALPGALGCLGGDARHRPPAADPIPLINGPAGRPAIRRLGGERGRHAALSRTLPLPAADVAAALPVA
jgi:hypothetical protein